MIQQMLVTGSTGRLGKVVCQQLQQRNIVFWGTTRRMEQANGQTRYLDLATGKGTTEALQGIDTILHLASDTQRFKASVDVEGTRRLLEAAQAQGVRHFVYVSIVGVDRMPLGYYKNKLAAEQLIAASGIPYSILRTTQYYYFLAQTFRAFLRLPLTFFPKQVLVQPMDEHIAAAQAVEIALGTPLQGIRSIGGRKVYDMGSLAKEWLAANRRSVWVLGLPTWGAALRAGADGALTCPDHALTAGISWEEWLARPKS